MHVKGGKMIFTGVRIMENPIAPATNLRYQSNAAMNTMDRKIQWKMFDRERDFCWQIG